MQVAIHVLNVSDYWAEPPAIAHDAIDGDLTSQISRAVGDLGAVSTSTATAPGEFFTITYSVANGGGLQALAAQRRVFVLNACAYGEAPCGAGGPCSIGGVCPAVSVAFASSSDAAGAAAAPPTVQLLGLSQVSIAAGMVYFACPPNLQGTAACDRGATARDAADGDLTPQA